MSEFSCTLILTLAQKSCIGLALLMTAFQYLTTNPNIRLLCSPHTVITCVIYIAVTQLTRKYQSKEDYRQDDWYHTVKVSYASLCFSA